MRIVTIILIIPINHYQLIVFFTTIYDKVFHRPNPSLEAVALVRRLSNSRRSCNLSPCCKKRFFSSVFLVFPALHKIMTLQTLHNKYCCQIFWKMKQHFGLLLSVGLHPPPSSSVLLLLLVASFQQQRHMSYAVVLQCTTVRKTRQRQ